MSTTIQTNVLKLDSRSNKKDNGFIYPQKILRLTHPETEI